MALTHSRFVPIAFWVGFVALGLVTSLGAPTKARPNVKGSHSLIIAKPAKSALALNAGRSSQDSRDKALPASAVQED